MKKKPHHRAPVLESLSTRVSDWTGGSTAFATALAVVVLWAATGPIFHYSDTWQLVINTGTTVITFLMVFLIQRSQNKDTRAIELKLNELVAAMEGASNRLIGIEELSESDLETLRRHYRRLSEMAAKEMDLTRSHSLDEARARHERKSESYKADHRA
ncbi:MAG TPA: low affinity iron permease family protein [Candidatus Eisenbacteria bacterium]|jgi:low affinity Fe/Cu permease|nr:low affinity iron permease family protein [Candidatus Eisenbacteria bacterium]